jgi:D-alanine-D-alanine ligase
MRIAVLAGGISPERDVSLVSGSLIARALCERGHEVCLLDVYEGLELNGRAPADCFGRDADASFRVGEELPELEEVRRRNGNRAALIGPGVLEICAAADVAFLALHGAMGENGQLQATLDNYGIRYTGSGYVGSLLAMDKDLSKQLLARGGVATPDWIYYDVTRDDPARILREIGLPCVVKPCSCGSSVGISLVDTEEELEAALEVAGAFEKKLLIEKKIVGRELTLGILDGQPLPAVEIIPKQGFYDYKNKYQAGATVELCPAPLTDAEYRRVAQAALRGFDLLRLQGYARFDFILDEAGVPWCLEANTLPGMTPTSLLPLAASVVGISYNDLCEMIVRL